MQEKEKNNIPLNQVSQKDEVSIGALLVSARNTVGMSQADVADQINLYVTTIDAIENDDFEKLPESIYVRGYLRNYAKAVGLDVKELITAYNKQHHVEPEISLKTSSKRSYDVTILWSAVAIATVLLGLLVSWWIDIQKPLEQNIEIVQNDLTITSDGIAVEIVEKTTEELSGQSPVPEEESALSSVSKDRFNTEPKQAIEKKPVNSKLATLNNNPDVLTVTFVEKSWTVIKDADLNQLMLGLIEPGVVRNLSGRAPFHIVLGNSPGVVIEINGKYFDHTQYNRSNRTARFQVSGNPLN